ncbi:MAG: hypothetical protein QF842_04590 [Candidatus Marinimicrobia bacterium]|jgi:hypothetical protein|nr:hypothetical protein [Candidatus Neomarinimicrobiota bacterium]MDP6612097.1 hypothetical protein [Candidatus Neomarinimicrobiota bacterium]|tara:strand:- start:13983 stop:14894 length:912 start_codon:yes stop_codon:yes gene_type:complete
MVNPVKLYRLILLFIFLTSAFGQGDSTIFDSQIRVKKPNESKTATIMAEVNPIDVFPTAYRLSIYPRNRPAEIFIQKLFFPGEPIYIILPADILNPDSLGNVAKLEPMGDNYTHQFRMFDAGEGEIRLTPFDVHVPMDIIKLFIMDETMKKPIPKSKIHVFQNGESLTSTQADTSGYTRVRITTKRDMDSMVLFSIDTQGQYPPWRGRLEVPEGISEKVIEISPFKLEKGESIYEVTEHFTPFRKGPENGAEVLFLLNKREHVAISKVAGDRLFGRVRVYIDTQNKYQNVTGWILRKHLFRKE